MNQRDAARFLPPVLLLPALVISLIGIGWGLPSRRIDPYLFGNHPAWSGQQIAQLSGERSDPNLGADVASQPIRRGQAPVLLNGDDSQRARIIRRYRLFSYQPDEMITMMSLASMKPGQHDFDPRLYQYGGLWIYPVGAMLKVAQRAGLITLAPSQAFYLENPGAFARFYVVARLYAAMWGLAGAWAIFRLGYNAGAGLLASGAAVLLYMFLPAVVDLSHEAKPHLPGAVLILLSALAAEKFVLTGKHRWWMAAGALCGAAMGMVLSGVLAFVIPPAMVLMRAMTCRRRFAIALGAAAVGAAVYFATNPYVLHHLAYDRTLLKSNLGNSQAMYQAGRLGAGAINAARLIVEGAAPLTAIAGLIGAIWLMSQSSAQGAGVRILIVVSIFVVAQFVALAAGKPGEYGRFALLVDIVLALSAATMIGKARMRTFEKIEALGLLLVLGALPCFIYLRGFIRDSGPYPRRIENAQVLANLQQIGARTLGVYDEPAPYLLPPVDVFRWQILLLPANFDIASGTAPADVIVRAVDQLQPGSRPSGAYQQISERNFNDLFPSRISWADKAIEIWVKTELAEKLKG